MTRDGPGREDGGKWILGCPLLVSTISSETLSLIKMTHEVGIGGTPSNVQLPAELLMCPGALQLASCCRKERKVVTWFGAHGIPHGIPK